MAKDKKYGFGQGSGSDLVDANIAADPIRNLPSALKVELKKLLKKGAKKMEDGGPAAPIMPEKAKKIRKYRNTRNDKTSLPKQVRDFIAEQDGKEVKTYQNGGAVMAGRGGKFKGVS
jgi:hypothetical protein